MGIKLSRMGEYNNSPRKKDVQVKKIDEMLKKPKKIGRAGRAAQR